MNRPNRNIRAAVLPAVLAFVSACSGSSDDRGAEGPAGAFESLEEQLVEASSARFDFTVTATGAVAADLSGVLALGQEGRARLEAEGTFAGEEVSLLLVSDGRRMRMVSGTDTAETATPPELKEALVLGLTRMGVLHNLARLTEVTPPDHAGGDVEDWVRVRAFREEERGALGFDLVVADEPAGSARLFLSPATGLPGERRQTVRFSDPGGVGAGEMQVTEIYGAVSVGAGAEPGTFDLDGRRILGAGAGDAGAGAEAGPRPQG